MEIMATHFTERSLSEVQLLFDNHKCSFFRANGLTDIMGK